MYSLLMAVAMALLALALSMPGVTAAGPGSSDTSDLLCSACRLLTTELHSAVEQEAVKGRTVETGSFRVDGQGNQRVTKIPYARSDTHLTGALDSACERLSGWGHTPHPTSPGLRGFVSLVRSDGRPVDTGRIVSGSSVDNWLRMRCESLMDDHEDALKSLLRQSEPRPLTAEELERRFCLGTAAVCTEDQLALQFEPPVDKVAEEAAAAAAAAAEKPNVVVDGVNEADKNLEAAEAAGAEAKTEL